MTDFSRVAVIEPQYLAKGTRQPYSRTATESKPSYFEAKRHKAEQSRKQIQNMLDADIARVKESARKKEDAEQASAPRFVATVGR